MGVGTSVDCCGIQAEYVDLESNLLRSLFLGLSEEEAVNCMSHVKAFL